MSPLVLMAQFAPEVFAGWLDSFTGPPSPSVGNGESDAAEHLADSAEE